ncbi:hypothetical protein ES708_24688 [subsurface metagenome]
MLEKKSIRATKEILEILRLSKMNFTFKLIQPVILRYFTSIYLQGRKDQADKVLYTVNPKGIITFLDK